MALRQKQVKRMLAFSSISQMGYIVFGLGVALYAGAPAGAQGSMFHIFNHGLMKGLAFLSAGALLFAIERSASKDGASHAEAHASLMISDLDGTAQRYPLVALAFSLALLGLGGLPPLAGFMSKWQIFLAGFAAHDLLLSLLVVFAALNSVLSLAYYAPLVNALYRGKVSENLQQAGPLPLAVTLPLALLSLGVVVIGLWPSLMSWLTVPAAAAVLAAFGLN
jgi:formate hydrogenlyase subunit 3/multisubunit Na+/H+ antiporter MnhD subunit